MQAANTHPHRHDLPINNTIDEEVVLVNAYIKEMAVRLNIQQRLCLRWIINLARRLTELAVYTPLHQYNSGTLTAAPLSLPHVTYADAVQSPGRRNEGGIVRRHLNFSKVATVFINARLLQTSMLRIVCRLLATELKASKKGQFIESGSGACSALAAGLAQ
ncbi:hypothetical protein J6590_079477 [Homalodisca vitripennis]|nr:hypothetical protein J6590_079477 [Homalodisca vitripennis]